MKQLVLETFSDDPHTALAVANCESGLNVKAYNANNRNGTVDRGLFQINSTHDKKMQELGLDPWNPEDNAKFARLLYDEYGWKPWTCYNKHIASL